MTYLFSFASVLAALLGEPLLARLAGPAHTGAAQAALIGACAAIGLALDARAWLARRRGGNGARP